MTQSCGFQSDPGAAELAVRRGRAVLEQVAVQPRQHGLRLRVAEAAVELEHLDAGLRHDQAGVEHAAVGDAAPAERRDDRLHHVLHGGVDGLLLEPRDRAVAAHAAGVGPLVAGEDALVVLRRRERHRRRAVAEHQQRDLGAGEVLLGDEHVAGVAELARDEAGADGLAGLVHVLADEHALAGGQAVGLDHQRVVVAALDVGERRLQALVPPVGAGGHAAGGHDLLGEDLAALELRGLLVGPEHGEAVLLEEVGRARPPAAPRGR